MLVLLNNYLLGNNKKAVLNEQLFLIFFRISFWLFYSRPFGVSW